MMRATGARAVLLLCITCFAQAVTAENAEDWMRQGREYVKRAKRLQPVTGKAKNVILFVGDGMGVSTVTAARILHGQLQGRSGEEGLLSFERLPYAALVKTYNTNQQVADSAGTMSAMVTGVKTKAGVLMKDAQGRPFTTLGYANGPGHVLVRNRADLTLTDTTDPQYLQETTVSLLWETHGGEDVPLYADGPQAHLFHGVMEQNVIFHVMIEALGMASQEP